MKLIAEPWDVGQGDSYDLGRFPPLWSEWNGKYRDTRARLLARCRRHAPRASRPALTGSSDLFGGSRRRPSASVNLVTVHDGFTLHDLVAYDGKHNEANGEENRDGSDDNRSWNSGAEGVDDRRRGPRRSAELRVRAMLTTLLTSFGAPLLLAGDEMGRTQGGNNNAYCQDNEISWVDWSSVDQTLLDFTKRRRRAASSATRCCVARRFLTGADDRRDRVVHPGRDDR